MKFVVRPYHIISLGGYIVEWDFPYRNVIVANHTAEPIKIDLPLIEEDWFEDNNKLGLDITPVTYEDNFLAVFKREHAKLDATKAKMGIE